MKKLLIPLVAAILSVGCSGRTDNAANTDSAAKKIRINVSLSVCPENRAALLDNLLKLAEASRAEEGCIGYEILENCRDTLRLMIVETWESAAALDAHQQTSHFIERAPLNGELSASSEMQRFEF